MFVSTIKSIWRNLKYVFMIAGIVYFAFIVALSISVQTLIAVCGESIKIVFDGVIGLLNGYINTFSMSAFMQFPELVSEILQLVNENLTQFAGAILAIIIFFILFILIFVEMSRAFAIINIKNEGKRKPLITLIEIIIRVLFSLLFSYLFIMFVLKWTASIVLLAVIYMLYKALMIILFSKLFDYKNVPIKTFLSVKAVLSILLMNFIVVAFTVISFVLLCLVFKFLVAAVLIVPIMIYFAACLETVCYKVLKKKNTVKEVKEDNLSEN